MATSSRSVGAKTSKTRDALLDHVEKRMLEEGYASVSYRALAAEEGVTPSLVQYYFPILDDIFLAAIRRYSERSLRLLASALEPRAEEPLRAVWEFVAGGDRSDDDRVHGARKPPEVHPGRNRRSHRGRPQVQLDALVAKFGKNAEPGGNVSLPALQLLISGLPKLLSLEEGIGVKSAHKEVTKAFEQYLDSVEPPMKPNRKPAQRRPR